MHLPLLDDVICELRLKPALALAVFEVEYFGSLGPMGNLTSGWATRKCLSCLFAPSPQVMLSAFICYTAYPVGVGGLKGCAGGSGS